MEIVSPGFIEWNVLKLKAMKFAAEQKRLLADPNTDPRLVEDEISWRVAINDVKYDLTYDQREELLKLIMDESGMTERQRRGLNRVG
jgi:hypothetical protein